MFNRRLAIGDMLRWSLRATRAHPTIGTVIAFGSSLNLAFFKSCMAAGKVPVRIVINDGHGGIVDETYDYNEGTRLEIALTRAARENDLYLEIARKKSWRTRETRVVKGEKILQIGLYRTFDTNGLPARREHTIEPPKTWMFSIGPYEWTNGAGTREVVPLSNVDDATRLLIMPKASISTSRVWSQGDFPGMTLYVSLGHPDERHEI